MMKNGLGRLWRLLFVWISLFFLLSLAVWWWPHSREVVYRFYREQSKERALVALQGYESQASVHFRLFYTGLDQNVAGLILETAEAVYEPVTEALGFEPPGLIPIIVYSTRADLRHAFGWGNGESALGVYWNGTIRLLSPNVWISKTRPETTRQAFRRLNPLAHELTHYVLDYMTDGNYPRWFTEGLAQHIEHNVSGYLWIERESSLWQRLYTLDELQGRFDRLSNQPLAYRQSYLLVRYLVEEYGEDYLMELIRQLSAGTDFFRAVDRTLGKPMDGIYAEWLDWVDERQAELDFAS